MADLDFKLVIEAIEKGFADLSNDLKNVQKETKKVEEGFLSMGKKMEGVGKKLSVAFTAPIAAFAGFSIAAFKDQEKNITKFTDSFEKQGAKLGFTFQELKAQAEGFAQNTLFQDDDILGGVTSQLLNFQIETKEIFTDAQKIIVDFAAKSGSDLGAATEAIGKALQNPAEGLSLLRRQGLAVTDGQIDLVTNLDKTGQSAKAQAEVIKLLEGQYENFAQKIAQTDSGQLDLLIKKFSELKEDFGEAFLKVLRPLISFFSDLIDVIRETTPETKVIIAAFAGIVAAIGPILVILPQVVAAFKLLGTQGLAVLGPIGIAIAGIATALIFLSEKFNGLKNVALSFALVINEAFLKFFTLIDKIPTALAAVVPGLGLIKAAANGLKTTLEENVKSLSASLDANIAAQQLAAKGEAAGKALGDGINKGLTQAQLDRKKQQEEFLKKADEELRQKFAEEQAKNAPKFAEGLVNFPPELDKMNGQLELLPGKFEDVTEKVVELSATGHILSDSFATFFEDIAFGAESLGDAFKKLGRTITQSLFSSFIRAGLDQFFGSIFPARAGGGPIRRAGGGAIHGPGTDTSDSILALVSNDEYVIKSKSARKLGLRNLDFMNKFGKLPQFNLGGMIDNFRNNLSGIPRFADGGSVSAGSPGMKIEIINQTSVPIKSSQATQRFDGQQAVTSIVLNDLRDNGPISQQMQGAFNVTR